jgi:Na+-transporting NADH:ubiquinone oxidoreductase subunit NqrB
MIIENNPQSDLLNTIGQVILSVDTRLILLCAVLFVGVFVVLLKLTKRRVPSGWETINLVLTVIQLYSAPVVLSMLVLTQPPAVDRVSALQRQSAGMIAGIFLIGGVISQIMKFWAQSKTRSKKAHSGG